MIEQLSRVGAFPHPQQFVNRGANTQSLGNENQARRYPRPCKLSKVSGHGIDVVRDQDSAVTCGECQHLRIARSLRKHNPRNCEVDPWVSCADAADDAGMKIGVCQKAGLQLDRIVLSWRARRAFSTSAGGFAWRASSQCRSCSFRYSSISWG